MSVFLLKPQVVPNSSVPSSLDGGKSGEGRFFTEDEARQAARDYLGKDTTGMTEDEIRELARKRDEEQRKEQKQDSLTISGPLGQYYTEALNREYALEDMAATALIAELIREPSEIEKAEEEASGYVYCVDARDLNREGLNVIMEMINKANNKGKKSLLVLENYRDVPQNVAIAIEHAAWHRGAWVAYGRKAGCRQIRSLLGV